LLCIALEIGYSIPFTAKKADELYKYCTPSTSYLIQKEGYKQGQQRHVDSFTDWKEGKVEHLLRFGHKASSYEEQILSDEQIGKFIGQPSPLTKVYT
jgi:hypothetical protein